MAVGDIVRGFLLVCVIFLAICVVTTWIVDEIDKRRR